MADTPVTTRSAAFGAATATSASPITTVSARSEAVTSTSATSATTVSARSEAVPSTSATALTTVSAAAAHTVDKLIALALLPPLSKVEGRTYGQPVVGLHVLGRAIGVNLTAGGSRGIFEANAAKTAVSAYVLVVCTSADAVTVLPTVRLTVDGNDMLSSQQLLGLDAVNKAWSWPLGLGGGKVVQSGQTVSFEVVTPSVATTHQADVFVFGYET